METLRDSELIDVEYHRFAGIKQSFIRPQVSEIVGAIRRQLGATEIV